MEEQLNHTNSETVYLDFSSVSLNIAQARAVGRRLSKVIWISDWLESIPRLGVGLFDFVQCSGVLHHLKGPQRGLNTLKDAQLRTGGASLMVYGKYGRIGVYYIQDLLRIINKYWETIDEEVKVAKSILEILPGDNWFQTTRFISRKGMENTKIYDLLLHKRDVSYSVSELYSWLQHSN